MNAIEISRLSKTFKQNNVLSDLSLSVKSGELFGLIGPDGAGKSTLFNILITLLEPDYGSQATIHGLDMLKDYKNIRKIIGYLPERFSLYGDLTCRENLEFFAMLYGESIKKNFQLIAPIWEYLAPFKNRKASALSGGMKQKLALCCALIHKPKILFLDEPTTGVDPVSRQELWQILTRLKNDNVTVFVSTSYMEEADYCHRIGLLQKGKLLGCNTPDQLKDDFSGFLVQIQGDKIHTLLTKLEHFTPKKDIYPAGQHLNLVLHTPHDMALLYTYIEHANLHISHIQETTPNVEDCFIQLMKE
jgi:ABC-type multidrug transport system ATPase subunit